MKKWKLEEGTDELLSQVSVSEILWPAYVRGPANHRADAETEARSMEAGTTHPLLLSMTLIALNITLCVPLHNNFMLEKNYSEKKFLQTVWQQVNFFSI